MSHVDVTPDASKWIAAKIAAFATEADHRHHWLTEYVSQFNALPLYVGWTETIGIRPNGEIVSWSTEDEFIGVRSIEDRMLVLISLVNGSRRFPELAHLLPKRTPGAEDCGCRDVPLLVSGRAFCGTCGGLGWLPTQAGGE